MQLTVLGLHHVLKESNVPLTSWDELNNVVDAYSSKIFINELADSQDHAHILQTMSKNIRYLSISVTSTTPVDPRVTKDFFSS